MYNHPDLSRLWKLAERLANDLQEAPEAVFDPYGLILEKEPLRYDATPVNAVPFAYTGGDGEHYSLVKLNNKIVQESPVVATLPMNFGDENLIIGENLYDFLCLGCRYGYFGLGDLSTHLEKAGKVIEETVGTEHWDKRQHVVFGALNKEFNLQPWRDVGDKIKRLQLKYKDLLDVRLDN